MGLTLVPPSCVWVAISHFINVVRWLVIAAFARRYHARAAWKACCSSCFTC